MRKLIAVGVLVGGLLAGAGSATAQPLAGQGGFGDPLTLAASGVLIPYITGGGTVAILEVASPVADNPFLHVVFYKADCSRSESRPLPETTNDIAFLNINDVVPAGTNGLVAIADAAANDFTLVPLTAPIHSRVYEFRPADGRSRVFEPVVLDTAGSAGNPAHFWSPLRTGATFYAPLETAVVNTQLTLVCPRTTIQGTIAPEIVGGSAFGFDDPRPNTGFSNTGFPLISPRFMTSPADTDMRALVYDTDENLLADTIWRCDCLTPDLSVISISTVYDDPSIASHGTYTELSVQSLTVGSFTGYRAVFTVGSAINNFWGRLSNASRGSLTGPTVDNKR